MYKLINNFKKKKQKKKQKKKPILDNQNWL